VLERSPKFVATRTLSEPFPWANTTRVDGDVGDAVAGLRAGQEKDLVILGSGELIATLLARGLIDEFVLLIHPLVLGSGKRLFRDGGALATFRLVDTTPTSTGVLIARYQLA
jgi:dihydrofolate reductase